MDTDSFIFSVETEDFYIEILLDLNEWYDTSKIDKKLNRCIPIGLNAGIIAMFKDELNGKVMSEFVALASKLYTFLDIDDHVEKKAKGVKKCAIKKVLKTQQYMDALLLNKTTRTKQQRFKSDHHTITTEEVKKIALSTKNDKRIQSFDGITTYPTGIDKDLLNESESIIRSNPIQLYYNRESTYRICLYDCNFVKNQNILLVSFSLFFCISFHLHTCNCNTLH